MKKKHLFIILLAQLSFSQVPSIEWQKSLGGTQGEGSQDILQTNDGGYIMTGYTFSADGDITLNKGSNDFWVVKTSNIGAIQWQLNLGGSNDEYANSIKQTLDGGYIVSGLTYSNDGDVTGQHGNSDFWIVKLSGLGSIEWQKTLGGTSNDFSTNCKETADGGYIVVGVTDSNNGDVVGNHGSQDIWVVKLSNLGSIEWKKSLGGTSIDDGRDVQQTVDGGYIIVGYTESSNGDVTGTNGNSRDAWVVKLSNSGDLQWQKTFGGSSSDRADSIKQTADGGYILACNTNSTDGNVTGSHGNQDSWILKLDSDGNLQWQKVIGGSAYEFASTIQLTSDGGYIVAGLTYSNDGDITGIHGGSDGWIFKLNSMGNLQWQKCVGGSSADYFYGIQQTSDNGYIVSGETYSNDYDVTGNHGYADFFVIKLEPETLGNNDYDYNDLKLYPNPSRDIITLSNPNNTIFDKITISGLTGENVVEQFQYLGQINVEKLASGIYIIKAFSGNRFFISKFIKE